MSLQFEDHNLRQLAGPVANLPHVDRTGTKPSREGRSGPGTASGIGSTGRTVSGADAASQGPRRGAVGSRLAAAGGS